MAIITERRACSEKNDPSLAVLQLGGTDGRDPFFPNTRVRYISIGFFLPFAFFHRILRESDTDVINSVFVISARIDGLFAIFT
jgi:hypothetical protein